MSYTNSSLTTGRRCLREFDLSYLQLLEPDRDDEREPLEVGLTWHAAHHAAAVRGVEEPFAVIRARAPSELWGEKLSRLFAAQAWYWREQPFEVMQSETTFKVSLWGDVVLEGQIDGIVQTPDGRRGVLERKTTGDGLEAESLYWNRLRMDVQVGIYALACNQAFGFEPSFILYDVVRKPTINPKNLVAADVKRMRAEVFGGGDAMYYGEAFGPEEAALALEAGRESVTMYGARLTADIGNRPEHYFARREVPRTQEDYSTLLENIGAQVRILEHAQSADLMHRNPDACATFGVCRFFSLCSHNLRPRVGDLPPAGFRRREYAHPELVR